MYRIRLLLGFAWIPVLSSCMMMGGTGDAGGMHSGQIHSALQQREASNGALTIVLSFPAPSGGATVPIDARFRTESEHHS